MSLRGRRLNHSTIKDIKEKGQQGPHWIIQMVLGANGTRPNERFYAL